MSNEALDTQTKMKIFILESHLELLKHLEEEIDSIDLKLSVTPKQDCIAKVDEMYRFTSNMLVVLRNKEKKEINADTNKQNIT